MTPGTPPDHVISYGVENSIAANLFASRSCYA